MLQVIGQEDSGKLQVYIPDEEYSSDKPGFDPGPVTLDAGTTLGPKV